MEEALRRHDRIAFAERRRRRVMTGFSWGEGCGCTYDTSSDGGEYKALAEARERRHEEHHAILEKEIEQKEASTEKDEDSDDDSEFDYLLDEDLPSSTNDDNDDGPSFSLRQLEEERMAELQWQAMMQGMIRAHGFGEHRQMHPKRILTAAGLGMKRNHNNNIPESVVLHLYDPESDICGELDLTLEDLSKSYKGTMFMRSSGRSVLLMNTDLIQQHIVPSSDAGFPTISDLPALLAIKNGSIVTMLLGHQQLARENLDNWLYHTGVLKTDPPPFDELCRIRPEEEALHENMMREKAMATAAAIQQEDIFSCGVKGCNKTYHHKHIGIANEEQDGKLLSEETTIPEK